MSRYTAGRGFPKADISVFESNVHILPPKLEGRTDDDGIPEFTHDYSLKESTIRRFPETIADPSLRRIVETRPDDATLTEPVMRQVAEHFADREAVPCNRCGELIWVDEWAGYYARNKCKDCDSTCSGCEADLSETKELVKREASVRLGNKYRCSECGRTWRGIATG